VKMKLWLEMAGCIIRKSPPSGTQLHLKSSSGSKHSTTSTCQLTTGPMVNADRVTFHNTGFLHTVLHLLLGVI
jgi:hypothetical protein